jgi:hypothetical protein
MRLFGRKSGKHRCPDCRYYAMVEGHGYCTRNIPSNVNVRLLSGAALKRDGLRCPDAMTCDDWEPM